MGFRRNGDVPPNLNFRADLIENSVMDQLFSLMDVEVVKGAVKNGTPNHQERKDLENRRQSYGKTIAANKKKISNLITLVEDGQDIPEVSERIRELRANMNKLEQDIKDIDSTLKNLPVETDIEERRKEWESLIKQLNLLDRYRSNGLGFEMKRKLIRLFFDGTGPDGKKLGVYIHYHPPKDGEKKPSFSFHAIGVFGDLYGAVNGDGTWFPKEDGKEAQATIMAELGKHHNKIKPFNTGKYSDVF